MTRLRLVLGLLAALGVTACTHVDSSHVLTGPQLQPSAPSQVRIFLEGQPTPPGYREIAIVEGRGDQGAGMPDVIDRLKEDAARLGANALINVRVDQGGTIVSVIAVAVRY